MAYNINNRNLLYYYPFNSDYLDYSTGTGVSNATTSNVSISTATTKLSSGSLLMPGNSAETVKIPNTTFTNNGITIAVWVKFNSIPNLSHRIFDFGVVGGGVNEVDIWFPDANGTMSLVVVVNNSIIVNNQIYTLTDLNWHHYCITFSATSTKFYVDGVLKTSLGAYYPPTVQLTSCLIGKSNFDANVFSYGSINANLNQFVVFNRVITSNELSYLTTNPSLVAFSDAASGYIDLTYPCFLQGTRILRWNPDDCAEEYVRVETLKRGDLVKTVRSGYKSIELIGHARLENPSSDANKKTRLYRFKRARCPELTEDLCITGDHCTLLYDVPESKLAQIREYMDKVYVTEGDYRVPACLDDRAEPYREAGPATIWHFALENDDAYMNYGVFANGLLVESSSLRYMRELSNMRFV